MHYHTTFWPHHLTKTIMYYNFSLAITNRWALAKGVSAFYQLARSPLWL